MSEFNLIDRYFKQRTKKRQDTVLGIGDDAALLSVPIGKTLVASTDTFISGVHFPVDTSARDIGYKVLAVNLSDLAAMGADPAWLMLALSLPEENKIWLENFCEGFFELCDQYGLQLVGGDTTRGSLSVTVQIMGFVDKDQAILRSGAKRGDSIFVTGSLGGAGLGLLATQHKVTINSDEDWAASLQKLNRPEPRIFMGKALKGIASAMIDISDGLLSDLGHMVAASHLGAIVHVHDLPLDALLKRTLPLEKAYELALTAGDDYELCFTVPMDKCEYLKKCFAASQWDCTCIGYMKEGTGIQLLDRTGPVFIKQTGYQHF